MDDFCARWLITVRFLFTEQSFRTTLVAIKQEAEASATVTTRRVYVGYGGEQQKDERSRSNAKKKKKQHRTRKKTTKTTKKERNREQQLSEKSEKREEEAARRNEKSERWAEEEKGWGADGASPVSDHYMKHSFSFYSQFSFSLVSHQLHSDRPPSPQLSLGLSTISGGHSRLLAAVHRHAPRAADLPTPVSLCQLLS